MSANRSSDAILPNGSRTAANLRLTVAVQGRDPLRSWLALASSFHFLVDHGRLALLSSIIGPEYLHTAFLFITETRPETPEFPLLIRSKSARGFSLRNRRNCFQLEIWMFASGYSFVSKEMERHWRIVPICATLWKVILSGGLTRQCLNLKT